MSVPTCIRWNSATKPLHLLIILLGVFTQNSNLEDPRDGTGAVVLVLAAISLGVTFGFGVLPYEPAAVVVIAGITIGNAMPAPGLSEPAAGGR